MKQKNNSRNLRWRIIAILLGVSLLPLGLVGIGSLLTYGKLLEEKTIEMHRRVIQTHAEGIDLYLAERLRALDLVVRTHRRHELENKNMLEKLLSTLNDSYGMAFIDLGVIFESGEHLAYVGPYDLGDKNYAGEQWFKDVMVRGVYLSDVFMGFRKVPHFVMAVRRQDESGNWLIRATMSSDVFDRLVGSGRMGDTGDVFVVNAAGVYQTPPKSGHVMEASSIKSLGMHQGVSVSRVREDAGVLVRATTWVNGGRWLLVAQQQESEIQAPVYHAVVLGFLAVAIAVVLVVVTTVLATSHLIGRVEQADAQRDALSKDLLRSAKLASLGEMSSGLAHEINNPLAIISAELTNIGDLITEEMTEAGWRDEIVQAVKRSKRQVQRCGGITAKMLQFGRKSDVYLQATDIGERLDEIVGLMRKQAEIRNVDIQLDVQKGLCPGLLDPTELEQVIANLINNSLYAIRGGGIIRIKAEREGKQIRINVIDNGSGIPAEDLERIFQPFFTTKPPGKGTGLGLAVCYGIVRGWGGDITASSRLGEGTAITIRLPAADQEAAAVGRIARSER